MLLSIHVNCQSSSGGAVSHAVVDVQRLGQAGGWDKTPDYSKNDAPKKTLQLQKVSYVLKKVRWRFSGKKFRADLGLYLISRSFWVKIADIAKKKCSNVPHFFIRGQLCNHDSTDSANSKIEVEIHYINLVEYGHQGGLYSPILARTHAELTAAQKCRACDISSVTFPISL